MLLCLHWRRGARQVTGSQSSLTLRFLRNEIQRKENKAMLQLGIPGYMQDPDVSDGLVCIEMYSYLSACIREKYEHLYRLTIWVSTDRSVRRTVSMSRGDGGVHGGD